MEVCDRDEGASGYELVRRAFPLAKLGSPAVKNGSPEHRASAIFDPCEMVVLLRMM